MLRGAGDTQPWTLHREQLHPAAWMVNLGGGQTLGEFSSCRPCLAGGYFGTAHHPHASSLRGSIARGGKWEQVCHQQSVRNDSCAKPEQSWRLMPAFLLFPQQTIKLLAQRRGVPRWSRWEQSGCPGLGLGGSSSLCSLGTGTRFFYNKSCFRTSLQFKILVCVSKPLGRGVQVGINALFYSSSCPHHVCGAGQGLCHLEGTWPMPAVPWSPISAWRDGVR